VLFPVSSSVVSLLHDDKIKIAPAINKIFFIAFLLIDFAVLKQNFCHKVPVLFY
jgi:hypothetical protein